MLSIAGISLLAYCAAILASTRSYQAHARQQLLRVSSPAGRITPYQPAEQQAHTSSTVDRDSSPLGLLEIPRIQLSAVIAEGSSARILRVAVGHIPGTALPQQPGNMALVAHRDTFFRRLGELKLGDEIRIQAGGNEYVYRVRFTDVVKPNETWVLEPATGNTLTLVTCYPFHFIGPAPGRFVVRARRIWPVQEARGR